jgi:hypothetical protein
MAYEFTDCQGRTWSLATTVTAARAVFDETKLSIYGLPQKKFQGLFDLISDPFRLVEVAWVLARGSHPELKREDFESSLDGPAIERLIDAVLEAIPDFFSDAPGRANLKDLIARARRLATRMVERDTAKIQAFDPEKADLDKLQALAEAQLASRTPPSSSAPSGSGPESSESTPDRSASPS